MFARARDEEGLLAESYSAEPALAALPTSP